MTGEIASDEMSGSTDELGTDVLNDGSTREQNAPYRPERIDVGAGRVETAVDETDV